MYYGSDEFNNAIENTQGSSLKTRLKFSDDEIIEAISSMRYYGGSNDTDDISIGNTAMAYVDVSAYTNKYLTGREFLLESGVQLSDGTYEYAPIGYFTVQTPSGDYDETSFTAYDRMIKFEKVYSSNLTYPTDSAAVLDEICIICGVTLATPIENSIAITENLKGYTCREVLGYIAGIHGFFACIDRFGELNLRWYSDTPIEKTLRYMWAFEKAQEPYEVEKIEVAKDSETAYTSGNGIITLHHSNPYATQGITDSLFAKLGGYSYMPAEIEMLDDIRLDPWDVINVTYYDGIAYSIPCMSIVHDFGAVSTTVKAVGKTSTENQYRFTGPTIQYLNRMATDLLVANRIIATKVDAEYVQAHAITTDNLDAIIANIKDAVIEDLSANFATIDYLKTNYADIKLANVEKADIGTLFANVGLITSATIVNGHITGYLDSVEVNANKITAGTLAVDRLVFRGKNSIIYELNNITGALQAVQGDTLNGEILTDRSITVDKIVANSITANEIAAGAITSSELATNAVTAAKIATNAITADKIQAGAVTADKLTVDNLASIVADIGLWHIADGKLIADIEVNKLEDEYDVLRHSVTSYDFNDSNISLRKQRDTTINNNGIRINYIESTNDSETTELYPGANSQSLFERYTIFNENQILYREYFNDYSGGEYIVNSLISFGKMDTGRGYVSNIDIEADSITLKSGTSGYGIVADGSFEANSVRTTSGADLDTINNNLSQLLTRAGASASVTIAANGYQSVNIPITDPSGYSLIAELGYATNNLNVVVYNFYKSSNANEIIIGIKNNLSSSQTITVYVYGLFIKSSYAYNLLQNT